MCTLCIRDLELHRTERRWDGSDTIAWNPCVPAPRQWAKRAPSAERFCPPLWMFATDSSLRFQIQARKYPPRKPATCMLGKIAHHRSIQPSTCVMMRSCSVLLQIPPMSPKTTNSRCHQDLTLVRLSPCYCPTRRLILNFSSHARKNLLAHPRL